MITIAICDDEKIIAEQIKRLASVFFRAKIWKHLSSVFPAGRNYCGTTKA